MNVAAANYMAGARRDRPAFHLDARIYRRLVIETALAFGYHIRLEHRSRMGGSVIRIVHPVAFQAASPAAPEGVLTVQLIRRTHQLPFPVAEVEAISLAVEHLPAGVVSRAGLTIGDAVLGDELGFGVVQEFPGSREDGRPRVLFALHGDRIVDDPAELFEGSIRRR